MKITDLKPEIVWKFFHQVTQVPRPSKKEGKIIEFLESFAKQYKIAIKKDAVGNILMSKPATPGKENLPTVVLQSHMDMVCERIMEPHMISTTIRSKQSSTETGFAPTVRLWVPTMASV